MYKVLQEQGYAVVLLCGDVDLACAPLARKTLLNCLKQDSPLLVDLSAVEYIDSSGVACLVEAYQTARKTNLDFGLIGVSSAAMSVFRLARLDQVFPIYGSVEECLRLGQQSC